MENIKRPLVVNLYGGASSGKSTVAAGLFYSLKLGGYSAEYVTEYAKDLVYDRAFDILSNQVYLFAEQLHRLNRVSNKNDIVIMDSPLLLGLVYDEKKDINLKNLALSEYNKCKNVNIFLERPEKYRKGAKPETVQRAYTVDSEIKNLLTENKIPFHVIKSDEEAVKNILTIVPTILH